MKNRLFLLTLIIIVSFTGCIERKSGIAVSENKTKGYIAYSIGTLPKDLVMLDNTETQEKDLLLALFEGLVKTDEENNIMPGIAESWTVSKDGLEYVFRLNSEAKYSDGKNIKAEDFVSFFSAFLKKSGKNLYSEELFHIFGAEDYSTGKKTFNQVAIKAVDEKTLQLRLNSPCDYLLDILAQPEFCLRKLDNNLEDWKSKYKKILYTGPFMIDEVSTEGKVTLVKNSKYYDESSVNNNKIVVSSIKSSEEGLVNFERDKIDLFINPPSSEVERLVNDNKAEIKKAWSVSGIYFNGDKGKLTSNIEFRKAVNECLDRSYINEEIFLNTREPIQSFILPELKGGSSGRNSKDFYSLDSNEEKAKEIISKVNVGKVNNLSIIYENNPSNKRLSEDTASKITKTLGVKCIAAGYSRNELMDRIKNGKYDMALVNINANYGEATSLLNYFSSKSKLNFLKYASTDFDAALVKSRLEGNILKKKQYIDSAEEILMKQYMFLPISKGSIVVCSKEYIEGIVVTGRGNVRLDKIYIDIYDN